MSNYDRNQPPTCESCGIEFAFHMGIVGTCDALQMARQRIAELHVDICANQKTIGDLRYDLSCAKASRNKHLRKLQRIEKAQRKEK